MCRRVVESSEPETASMGRPEGAIWATMKIERILFEFHGILWP